MAQSSFSALCIDYLPGMGTCTVMPLFTLCAGRTVFNLAFATRRRLNRLTADVVSYYAHVTDELPRWNTRLELQLVDSRLDSPWYVWVIKKLTISSISSSVRSFVSGKQKNSQMAVRKHEPNQI